MYVSKITEIYYNQSPLKWPLSLSLHLQLYGLRTLFLCTVPASASASASIWLWSWNKKVLLFYFAISFYETKKLLLIHLVHCAQVYRGPHLV